MRPGSRNLLIGVGAVLVGIQLVPVDRSNPPVTGELDVPEDVAALLDRSCRDCHSNRTVWPWYSRVAPVSWLVAHDVDEGREQVNFSEWAAWSPDDRDHALEEIVEVMEEAEMPLRKYVWLHPEAGLSASDRTRIADWARAERSRLEP